MVVGSSLITKDGKMQKYKKIQKKNTKKKAAPFPSLRHARCALRPQQAQPPSLFQRLRNVSEVLMIAGRSSLVMLPPSPSPDARGARVDDRTRHPRRWLAPRLSSLGPGTSGASERTATSRLRRVSSAASVCRATALKLATLLLLSALWLFVSSIHQSSRVLCVVFREPSSIRHERALSANFSRGLGGGH